MALNGTGKFKLKLNTSQTSQPSSDPTPTPTTALRLNFGTKPSQSSNSASTPKADAKTPKSGLFKKRTHDDAEPTTPAPSSKKIKPTILRLKTSSQPVGPVRKGSIIKLKKSDVSATPVSAGFRPALKIKHKGKVPPRPVGAGYDSECSDAEDDPAIEENLVLRMVPGADADYIRKAIEERKVGVPVRDGGADLSLRFFQRDARRACVRVQDRFYSAVLVDLPCVVESMKSWDKKGWWKAADVCQMLLVTGKVENEDAARNVPLPREVDEKTFAYPHGLTPPMWDVRRRRFRKRASHRTIEQAEEEVERLLAEDDKARKSGGSTSFQQITADALRREEDGLDEDDYDDRGLVQDAEGDYEDMDENVMVQDEEEDEDDFMAKLQDQLGDDDEDADDSAAPTPMPVLVEAATPVAETERSNSLMPDEVAVESAAEETFEIEDEGPNTPGSGSGSSDEDDDDDDDASDEDISEEAREKREQMAQQKEEIAHLERQIAEKRKQLDETSNPLLRSRIMNTIKKFEEDRDVKKRGIGMGLGDDGED